MVPVWWRRPIEVAAVDFSPSNAAGRRGFSFVRNPRARVDPRQHEPDPHVMHRGCRVSTDPRRYSSASAPRGPWPHRSATARAVRARIRSAFPPGPLVSDPGGCVGARPRHAHASWPSGPLVSDRARGNPRRKSFQIRNFSAKSQSGTWAKFKLSEFVNRSLRSFKLSENHRIAPNFQNQLAISGRG